MRQTEAIVYMNYKYVCISNYNENHWPGNAKYIAVGVTISVKVKADWIVNCESLTAKCLIKH